jgi:Ca2+-binding RTX toxin-like protein
MSEATPFQDRLRAAVSDFTYWDALNVGATTVEQYFERVGLLAAQVQRGEVNAATAARLKEEFRVLGRIFQHLNDVVSSEALPAITDADKQLKRYIGQLHLDFRFVLSQVDAAAASVVLGNQDQVGRLGALAANGFEKLGAYFAVAQIVQSLSAGALTGDADWTKNVEKATGNALGFLAGLAGGSLAAGGAAAVVASVGIATPALVVAAGIAGGVLAGYFLGKSAEALWEYSVNHYKTHLLPEVLDGVEAMQLAVAQKVDDFGRNVGRISALALDTELSDFLGGLVDLDSQGKASFVMSVLTVTSAPNTAELHADLTRLFDAPFQSAARRDFLLSLVLNIAIEQQAYPTERVSVVGGFAALSIPPLAPNSLGWMRSKLVKSLDQFDAAGIAVSGPSRVLVSLSGGDVQGGSGNEVLVGGQQADRLIAGGGNDELLGGNGSDVLFGNEGTDVLLGEAGNDELDGGDGSDYLYGGAGLDTYRFTGQFGGDWIKDSDGQGTIIVDGVALSGEGAKRLDPNVSVWKNQSWVFSQVPNGSKGFDLIIQRDSSLNTIRIGGWVNGQLGINLGNEVAQVNSTSQFTGDFAKEKGHWYTVDPVTLNYISAGPQPNAQDNIFGSDGSDLLQGFGGNDFLYGGWSDDLIEGGAGDDLLNGGDGSDKILGGEGNDHIYGSSSNFIPNREERAKGIQPVPLGPVVAQGFGWVIYDGGIDANGLDVNITLSDVWQPFLEEGGNYIDGGPGSDYISAGTGHDTVEGGPGNDHIFGMRGNDVLFGGADNDLISGDGITLAGYLSTTLAQHHGNDVLFGGDGDDDLRGQGGDDKLYGGENSDKLIGDDNLNALPGEFHGRDELDGGPGHDELRGGGKSDQLIGGSGNDRLWGDAGGVPQTSPLWLDPTLHGADHLDGGEGDDYLQGEGGADILLGGGGNDELFGDDAESNLGIEHHGVDRLDGGDGDDYLEGHGKGDILLGGPGADTLYGDGGQIAGANHGSDFLDGGTGNDWLSGDGGADTLYGGEGDDDISGDGRTIAGQFHGADTIDGGLGNDVLAGNGGRDYLSGGEGNDALWGDERLDRLAAQWHDDDHLAGGAGNDQLFGGGGDDVLSGGAGDDWLAGENEEAVDSLSTLDGNDQLDGDAGNDTLVGGRGDDQLNGGSGNDAVYGGPGNDWLTGGPGQDTLDGGAGNDIYVIDSADAVVVNGVSTRVFDRVRPGAGRDTVALLGSSINTLTIGISANGVMVLADAGNGVGIEGAERGGVGVISLMEGDFDLRTLVNERLSTVVDRAVAANGEQLWGGALADTLRVNPGVEGAVLSAGGGDDTIQVNSSHGATIRMAPNAGHDWLSAVPRQSNTTAKNVIQLDAGISPNDVRLIWRSTGWATLSLGAGTALSVQVPGAASPADVPLSAWPFDEIRFADGSVNTVIDVIARGVLTMPVATNGDDVLTLTPVGDVFHALGGDDYIDGAAGDDQLMGGDGRDTLIGGLGNDTLIGGRGSDRLEGGAGNDTYGFDQVDDGDDTAFDSATSDDVYSLGPWLLQTNRATARIEDLGGTDRLRSTAVFSTEQVRVWREDTDLVIGGPDRVWGNVVRFKEVVKANDQIDTNRVIEQLTFGDGVVWGISDLIARSLRTTTGNDQIHGFADDEVIDGGLGADWIRGGAGNDDLRGGAGRDALDGGAGNDVLRAGADGGVLTGGTGDDRFIVSSGDGAVSVTDLLKPVGSPVEADRLVIDSTRAATTVTVQAQPAWSSSAEPDTLTLSWGNPLTSVSVLLQGAIGTLAEPRGVIQFSDGTTTSITALVQPFLATGTPGPDSLSGTSLDEVIDGGDGNDAIHGGMGADRLVGGAGDDQLLSRDGSDTFVGGRGADHITLAGNGNTVVHSPGDGADTIHSNDSNGSVGNAIHFSGGVLPGAIRVTWVPPTELGWVPSVLSIGRPGTGDHLLVKTGVYDGSNQQFRIGSWAAVQEVKFDDATTWTLSEILQRANAGTSGNDFQVDLLNVDTLSGGAGNDSLYGWYGDDLLIGGEGADFLSGDVGNDTLIGGPGNDVIDAGAGSNLIRFAVGDGVDRLVAGTNRIELGAGLVPAAVQIGRTEASFSSFRMSFGGADAIDVQGGQLLTSGLPTEVRFADGTVWNRGQLAERLRTGGSSNDIVFGFHDADDMLDGGSGDDVLAGGYGSDHLRGGAGNDVLYGRGPMPNLGQHWDMREFRAEVVDVLEGGAGNDTLHGGRGNNIYVMNLGFGHDTLAWSPDFSADPAYTAIVAFGPGISAESISVVRAAPYGELRLLHTPTGDTVTLGVPITRVEFSNGTQWSYAELQSRVNTTPTSLDDYIVATPGDDTINALSGNDVVLGGAGNDVLLGELGDDTLRGEAGGDRLEGGDGNDTLHGGPGNDLLIGGAGNDTLHGDGGTDELIGGPGNDVFYPIGGVVEGGAGDDMIHSSGAPEVYRYGAAWGRDTLAWFSAGDRIQFDASVFSGDVQFWRTPNGGETLVLEHRGDGSSISIWSFFSSSHADRMISFAGGVSLGDSAILSQIAGVLGSDGPDTIVAQAGGGLIEGRAGDDSIQGSAVADVLNGGSGNDRLTGGLGDDIYVVDAAGDVVIEGASAGTDTVRSSISWTLGSNLENLELLGSLNINGTGNSLVNALRGNSGQNVLNGGAGSDNMAGGAGDDVYIVDSAGDVVVELANEGSDTVQAGATFVLPTNVENLILTGTAAINGTGNGQNNALTGNSGANTLDGGGGADVMTGGAGNDTYHVDSTGDQTIELADGGTDLVRSAISWTLAAHVENLTLTGAAAVNGTGNGLNNSITGNSAANTLDGGLGNDTLAGGAGDDTYVVDSASDVVTEATGAGTDTVLSSVTLTLPANVENLTLTGTAPVNGTGNSLNNVLRGNGADNTLNGGGGSDTMVGGAGNDVYVVDAPGDVVTESANEGLDLVQSSVTYALGAHVENLTLTGTSAIDGTGNSLNNVLVGNGSNNTLIGGSGNDTMTGGAGNDTYEVDSPGDQTIEASGGGTDLVRSSITWTLADHIENLTLTGSASINGVGNALNNTLTGNAAANALDGGLGNDTMVGGAGDDTYVVDSASDVVTEAADAGVDTVVSGVTLTLAANVENLTLTGTAPINGTGNGLNNVLRGNSANNTLSGGAGSDTMLGGGGDDVYVVDATGDVVTEELNAGMDLVQSAVTYTLSANVENLTLTGTAAVNGTGNALNNVLMGNSANNTLTGGAGDDTLDGGAGTDIMIGGAGNDQYVVNAASDVVTEVANEGTDTVVSSVTLTLSANVENLTLTGTSAINATGNVLDNVLMGNSAANILTGGAGNDWLEGGAGSDTLVGGTGNDTYVVDIATDVVTEGSAEGTDTVRSPVSWTLGANLENLTLTGTATINGTGNSLDNTLVGNEGANTLSGAAGNDTLDGAAGTDTLAGGAGADSYVFGRGWGTDTIQENDSTANVLDRVLFGSGVSQADTTYRRVGNNLEVSIANSTDKLIVENWYVGAQHQVEQFRYADGTVITNSQVATLVNALGSFGSAPGALVAPIMKTPSSTWGTAVFGVQ